MCCVYALVGSTAAGFLWVCACKFEHDWTG